MTERHRTPLPYGTQAIDEADVEAVTAVLRGGWLTTGPAVGAFEAALATVGDARFAVAVNSGTAALHTAYAACGLGDGVEIVTSPLTFVATASAALMLDARVTFVDVDPVSGLIDPGGVAAAIGPDTRLLVPVDYAGHPADYTALTDLATRTGTTLVADASHSLGARYDGRPVGGLADATTLSFHPVKSITTGEGGVMLTNSEQIADAARRFRNHGIVRSGTSRPAWHYEIRALGMNYRIPDILCALGISQLGKLERFIARRRELAARYAASLADVPGIGLPIEAPNVESSWHLYVLRVDEAERRDAFFDALRADGLGVQLHYVPVYHHPLFESLGYRPGLCPNAERFAARAVSIPLYPRMTDSDADRVITAVRDAAKMTL